MRILITLILVMVINQSFCQERIDDKKIRDDLVNLSATTLNITVNLPNSNFYVGTTLEPIEEQSNSKECTYIQTTRFKNSKIIGILDDYQLLGELFIETNNEYIALNSDKTFNPKNTRLYLMLFFKTVDYGYITCYIPVFKQKKAKKLVEDLSKVFEGDNCFKVLLKQKI